MAIRVVTVFGTRPEAIKLAPVVRALEQTPGFESRVVVTGQHREMLDQVLGVFGICPWVDLSIMRPGQSLTHVTSAVLQGLEPLLAAQRPDAVLVQGDTTTTFAAALAAYYQHVPVGHVEAGLRSDDPDNPFPEEINRRLTTVLARWHFAPTRRARDRLVAEGVPAGQVWLTGNTVIDALQFMREKARDALPVAVQALREQGLRLLLVTTHRRESWGAPLRSICVALRDVVARFSDVGVVVSVHPNPQVSGTVRDMLEEVPRTVLLDPPDYLSFLALLEAAYLVLTDSGGVQEEAPALGRPVLVLRKVTERPEGVAAGCARLVGTERESIVAETARLLEDPHAYAAMARVANPYGDGRATERIVEALAYHFGLTGAGPEPFGA